mmetsp:Transcript_70120/g.221418  ORF Transcript_70120/g.221418 Transcript_70120/m.221418 type:complete len:167 (+) Transcript_70120:77-577(+)
MFSAQMGSLIDMRAVSPLSAPQVQVPESKPQTSPSPIRSGPPFLNPVSAQGIKLCSNCGGRGHVSRVCPSPKECDCCGAIKHQKAQCPHSARRCQICGKRGHMAMKCAQKDLVIAQLAGFMSKGKGKGGSDDQVCWDFQRGTCTHGDKCRWQHIGANWPGGAPAPA